MNTYIKYCPNVYLAACDDPHERGDIIEVETKHGKTHECEVHNYMGRTKDGKNCYSVTRTDGVGAQERARRRAERLAGYAQSAVNRGSEWVDKASEGRDFLSLAEPIKVGHHSEKRHRSLIERNNRRMGRAVEEWEKAKSYQSRIAYWEAKSYEVNLSMPESIDYYEAKLEQACAHHQGLKDGTIPICHQYSVRYAAKAVKDISKNLDIAKKLWATA